MPHFYVPRIMPTCRERRLLLKGDTAEGASPWIRPCLRGIRNYPRAEVRLTSGSLIVVLFPDPLLSLGLGPCSSSLLSPDVEHCGVALYGRRVDNHSTRGDSCIQIPVIKRSSVLVMDPAWRTA